MSKTPSEVDHRYHRLMQRLTPAERLAMACRMFSTARALVVAGLRSQDPGIEGPRLRRALLERLYGRDLTAEQMDRFELAVGRPDPAQAEESLD